MPKDLILMPLFGEAYFLYLTRNKSLLEKRTLPKHCHHHQNARLACTLYFSYISYSLHKYSEYFIIYIHICSKTCTLHILFCGLLVELWRSTKDRTFGQGRRGRGIGCYAIGNGIVCNWRSVELGAEDEAVAAVIDCPDLWLAGSVVAFGMVDDVEQAAFEGAEEHAVT